jgi:2-hydroxy-6-oxonona-2,4-dienedioate hydrolase
MTIFNSPADKEKMLAWHKRFRDRIGRPTESQMIETSFGPTHVLLCGPKDAPPIVLLHGALASSAHALLEVASLADTYRVIALDVIGQSPLSAEVRPEVNGNAYGQWAVECLDQLNVKSVRMLAASWGGFIALRTAALAPERILKLSLVVPAALVQGSGWEGFTKQGLPMMLYKASPTQARLEKFAGNLFTTMDPDWLPYIGDAFRGYKMDFRPPRLVRDDELKSFTAPVQVFAADQDVSFPGAKLLARAKRVFPNLAYSELLVNTKHTPSFEPSSRCRLAASIASFMK